MTWLLELLNCKWILNMFKDKTLLITGGTGSFGNTVLKRFVNTDFKEIRIFSRDEKKQDDMRKVFNNSKVKFKYDDVEGYVNILKYYVTLFSIHSLYFVKRIHK